MLTIERISKNGTSRGDMQDKLRAALLTYGQKEISLTIDDLIGKTGLNYSQIYQALYRLQRLGELEILREQDYESGKHKVSGVRLARMEPIETITQRSVDNTVAAQKSDKDFSEAATSVPITLEYLNQKTAIEKARLELLKSNLDPDAVLNFTPNPIGEEALYLLARLQDSIETVRSLSNDLEAERRNVRYYKERLGTLTFDDSGT